MLFTYFNTQFFFKVQQTTEIFEKLDAGNLSFVRSIFILSLLYGHTYCQWRTQNFSMMRGLNNNN